MAHYFEKPAAGTVLGQCELPATCCGISPVEARQQCSDLATVRASLTPGTLATSSVQVNIAQEAIRGQPLQPGAALTLSASGHSSVQARRTARLTRIYALSLALFLCANDDGTCASGADVKGLSVVTTLATHGFGPGARDMTKPHSPQHSRNAVTPQHSGHTSAASQQVIVLFVCDRRFH